MNTIPFHQYQRYKMVQIIIEQLRENNNLKILEVGANEHSNLEKFLPNDEIYYLDIELSEEKLIDKHYIKGDATNLQFNDSEFDYIIALDVLEHIPEERRVKFFDNINRVCKYGFIICFPFDNNETKFIEERIEHVYKYMYNKEIIWHEEHKKMGLPNLKDIDNIIKNTINLKTIMIYHGDNYLFEKLMNAEAINNTDFNINDYWQSINMYYNENVFFQDRVEEKEKAIRTFMVYHKDLKKIQNCEEQIIERISTSGNSKEKIYDILDDYYKNIMLAQIDKSNKNNDLVIQFNELKKEYSNQLEFRKDLEKEYNNQLEFRKNLEKEYNNELEFRDNLEREYNKEIKYVRSLENQINQINQENLELTQFKQKVVSTISWKVINKLKRNN